MGIEKAQVTRLGQYYQGRYSPPDPAESSTGGGKTPNQTDMALAIALSWAAYSHSPNLAGILQANLDHLRNMDVYGHMATGPDYRNEQSAPDPHTGLWYAGNATRLRIALALNSLGSAQSPRWWSDSKITALVSSLLSASTRFWAVHMALLREFWTSLGPRMPCARAKPAPGRPLAPNWTVDATAGHEVMGLPLSTSPHLDRLPVDMLVRGCAQALLDIRKTAGTIGLSDIHLGVPVRRWVPDDDEGMTSAFARPVRMNDPMAWVSSTAEGKITGAGNTLDDLRTPSGRFDVVGGSSGSESALGTSAPPAPAVSSVSSTSPAPSPDIPAILSALRNLTLGHRATGFRVAADSALSSDPPNIEDAATQVRAIRQNVNPGQVPAVDSILASLTDPAAVSRP